MRGVEKQNGKIYGRREDELYPITDDQAGYFYELWNGTNDASITRELK